MASGMVAVRAGLAAHFAGRVRVVTSTPGDLEANLPLIKVVGAGGPQTMNLASERVVVELYDSAVDGVIQEASINLVGEVNDYLAFTLRGVVGGAVISKIRVESVPAENVAYGNPNVSQQVARYLVFHRPSY